MASITNEAHVTKSIHRCKVRTLGHACFGLQRDKAISTKARQLRETVLKSGPKRRQFIIYDGARLGRKPLCTLHQQQTHRFCCVVETQYSVTVVFYRALEHVNSHDEGAGVTGALDSGGGVTEASVSGASASARIPNNTRALR